jgi:predicted metal-dependent hydrolase
MKKIEPRPFPRDSLSALPRHWLAGKALPTHLANGVSILFPAGERFFVRSVRKYLALVEKHPELIEQVKGFSGQEGFHARAHDEQIEVLEAQGYRVQPYLRAYEAVAYGFLEKVFPPNYRLATTAACEHFTAIMAEGFLGEGFERADPAMRRLLMWHACEEIEHRSVAFDVLALVDPRYSTRMAGLAIATVVLGGFWLSATTYLMAQEPDAARTALRELREVMRFQPFGARVFGRGIREYLARDFHPANQTHLDALAAQHIDRAMRGEVAVAAE